MRLNYRELRFYLTATKSESARARAVDELGTRGLLQLPSMYAADLAPKEPGRVSLDSSRGLWPPGLQIDAAEGQDNSRE